MPQSRSRLTTYDACNGAASRDSRSSTKSIPRNSPEPRTSPINACRVCNALKLSVRCSPTQSTFHSAREANGTRRTHVAIHFREVSRRKNNLPADAWQRFRDVRGDTTAFGSRALQDFCNMPRIFCARLLVATAIRAAVIVRKRRNVHPRLSATAPGTVKFVGADVNERVGVAVIGVFQHDHVFSSGMCTCEPQSQFIGLAARIHKKTNA